MGVVLVEPKAIGIGAGVAAIEGSVGNVVSVLDTVVIFPRPLRSCSLRIHGEGATVGNQQLRADENHTQEVSMVDLYGIGHDQHNGGRRISREMSR